MSYLDVPRVHFAGSFFADPSTLNNVAANYVPGATTVPLWDPAGRHWFYFENCTVRTGLDSTGKLLQTAADDPIIGATIESTNNPQFARLVDLDVDWQLASQIWGLEIKINASGTGDQTGKLTTATMRDLWLRVPGVGALTGASGAFQSVLTNMVINPLAGPTKSSVLNNWTVVGGRLSVKFVLYGYDATPTSSRFRFGKVVGTIGPASATEPEHFVAARRMVSASGAFGAAPFKVDTARNKLVIDLGNALPQVASGGAPPALGTLQARVAIPGVAAPRLLGGPILYDQPHYQATAGVEEVSLTPGQVTLLASRAVSLAASSPGGVILAERPGGSYLDASETALRLNVGESKTIEFAATVFGVPRAGQTVGLRLKPGGAGPATALTFPATITTNAAGRATATFTGGDPGHPRPNVDGALYQVAFDWGVTAPGSAPSERGTLFIRVFDRVPAVVSPTWTHIQPILAEYAQLYPSMKSVIDLSKQTDVAAAGTNTRIRDSLNWPITDPRYMPVTRDMSDDKRTMLLRWIARGCP